jgi:antitoxin component YwqK of YwqJK toxin-antitoxin module
MTEQNLKNGKQEGISKKYYKNGKIQAELNFKNGKQEGISKEYRENGRIRFIDTYKAGKMINRKSYSRKGNLEFDQDYQYVE